MVDKLNLYDLLGYLIPGGVLLLVGYTVGVLILPGIVPAYHDAANFSESLGGIIILLALSYPLGHLVQSIGEWWEDRDNSQLLGIRPSERMLLQNPLLRRNWDHAYSKNMQDLIKDRGCSTFGLQSLNEPNPLNVDYANRLKELFSLAWCLVIQKELSAKGEIYLAISALSRGLMVSSAIGVLLAGILVINAMVAFLRPAGIGPIHLSAYEPNQLGIGLAMLLLFGVLSPIFQFHWFRFRLYFARSIWDSFLLVCPTPEKNKQHWWDRIAAGSNGQSTALTGSRK